MSRKLLIIISCISLLNAETKPQKKAIVIGASTSMGRQVAKLLGNDGYEVGLVARRMHLLESLAQEIKEKTYIKRIDVSEHTKARAQLEELIQEMGGIDLMLISISAATDKFKLNDPHGWDAKIKTINVDLVGFLAMADCAMHHFEKQKSGHLVGISSTSGLRGEAGSPVYSGAKAFISRYLEAMRNRMHQREIYTIHITDIVPGWVEIEDDDIHKVPGAYWVATKEQAGKDIYEAIKSKKKRAFVTKRWQLIAWAYAVCPDWLYNKLGGF